MVNWDSLINRGSWKARFDEGHDMDEDIDDEFDIPELLDDKL